jgi:hypothetical protein
MERVLDADNGRIGSRIAWRLKGADDDDRGNSTYYTGLRQWHKTDRAGRLEAYALFDTNHAYYEGRTTDEWGFSSVLLFSFAHPTMRLTAPDGSGEQVYDFLYFIWTRKEGESWRNEFAPAKRILGFYFRSDETYEANTWILLEAGIENVTWFNANDVSLRSNSDLDFKMDSIRVRSI